MKRLVALLLMAFTILSPFHIAECQVKETFGTSNLSYQHSAMYGMDSLIANKLHRQISALSSLWKGFRSFGSDPEHETTFSFLFKGQFVKSGGPNNDKINRSMDYGSQIYLPDTVLVRGEDVPVRYSYSYNADGRIISELIEKWQDSQWIDSLLYAWTYDEYGREYTQLDQVWQDSQWVNDEFVSYGYDANGNASTVLTDKWQNSQWTNLTSTTYTYDSNGNALAKLLIYWQDSLWVKEYGERYIYDANGNMLTMLHELYDSTQTVYYSWQATFTYDANGNVLTETDQDIYLRNLNYLNTCILYYKYKYDSSDHLIENLIFDSCNNDTVRVDCTYDAHGDQTSESEWDGYQPYLTLLQHDTTTYSYDSNGNLALLVHHTLQNSTSDLTYGAVSFNRIGNFYDYFGDTISLAWEQLQVPAVRVAFFTAQTGLDSVSLTWNTLYEENNMAFNILRKTRIENGFSIITGSTEGKTPHVPGINEAGERYSFVDSRLEGAGTYSYKLQAINNNGSTSDLTTIQVNVEAPSEYALYQNYPNPFNPSTTITFDLNQASIVTLDIYNVLGQKVAVWNYGTMNPGRYNEVINMSRYASGVYFYRLVAGNFVQTKKLMLVK